MDEKTRKFLCELEDVMMGLFRSAANLDKLIQLVEFEAKSDDHSPEYLEIFIKGQKMYRDDYLRYVCSLANKEEDVWSRYFND